MDFENAGYTAPAHQREVDAMMAAIRANPAAAQRSIFKAPPPGRAPSGDALDLRLAEELEMIRRRLDQIGDILVHDPILLHRHAASLQGLDLTDQVLVHLTAVIRAQDKSAAVEAVSMQDLKARLKRRSTGL